MSSIYEVNKQNIERKVTAQKYIYKFRMFLYSLNKDIRQVCFRITKEFLENELQKPELSTTERVRVDRLLAHWQWNTFETTSTAWWSTLAFDHTTSLSLMTIIHIWIDNITEFNSEIFETSTDGLR